jgi:hypothetical protein
MALGAIKGWIDILCVDPKNPVMPRNEASLLCFALSRGGPRGILRKINWQFCISFDPIDLPVSPLRMTTSFGHEQDEASLLCLALPGLRPREMLLTLARPGFAVADETYVMSSERRMNR